MADKKLDDNISTILAQCDEIEATCDDIQTSIARSLKIINEILRAGTEPTEPNRIEYNDADGADINRLADKFGRD